MQPKKKILVVDDENALRRALVDSFKAENLYDLFEASDGEAALEIIRKEHPNLVLLDISMPKMDGITLSKKMEKEKLLEKTKIIFLTNSTDMNQIASAMEMGDADYLIKADWDMNDIVNRVKEKMATL